MTLTYSSYKNSLISSGFLVPISEEQAHARKYNVDLYRLKNGALILNSHLKQNWLFNTEIEISSFVGAYFDPKNKHGLAHFYEHVMYSDNHIHNLLDKHSVENNASTSSSTLKSYIKGIYNPEKSKFGMESVYKTWLKNYLHPTHLKNKRAIDTERQVILTEIHNYYSNFQNVVWYEFDKLIFDKTNFKRDKILGTKTNLQNIKSQDFKSFNKNYIVPKNIAVKLASWGSYSKSKSLVHKILPIIDLLPNKGTRSQIDYIKSSKVKKLNNKKIIKIPKDTAKNTAAYGLTWNFKIKRHTADEVAFDMFSDFFFPILRLKLREVANAYTFRHSGDKCYPDNANLSFHIINNTDNSDKKLELVKKSALRVLKDIKRNPTKLESYVTLYSQYLKAKVYSPPEVINHYYNSYRDFGLITNIDYVVKIQAEPKLDYLMRFVDEMLKTEPVCFMIGDIK